MSEEESKDLDEDIEAYDAQDDEEKVQLPPEQELNQLLKDISCLLGGLNGQLQVLETTIKQLPKEQEQLENATAQIACIANGLADDLRKQCLEEYIGILKNVEKNYNRLQEEAEAWQKTKKNKDKLLTMQSNYITWILFIILIVYIVINSNFAGAEHPIFA